eukprot:TRINITY_DN4456_c0_g1_i2.p1 TRINITY_DN4456_c0_g1~~TRINITY_DN4456_c0_g1_i2.p1  ORF type:complete len:792 (+),score=66.91 TRINITY_DN4456_c0_g1_i2:366-2741(+)
MRIKLYENSSSPVPASPPIATQNLLVEIMWDWDERTKVNFTSNNATLTIEYLPTTTWLVLAYGSSIHPAVWLNVSASLGFIDSNIFVTSHTVIATYIQDYDPVGFNVVLEPLRGASAAVLSTSSPTQWNLVAQNLWKFDIMLSDTAGSLSPSSKIGSCDESNVTVSGSQISCAFPYKSSYGMVLDPRFYVSYLFSGAYYARGVLVSPSPTRNFSYVSNSTAIVASSGTQETAALVSQPINVTLISSSPNLPTILVDITSFLVVGGSRSYECRRSVFFDTLGRSIRCLVPANTLRLTPYLNVVVGLYNNSQIISTQLNFSLVNQPVISSSLTRRIAKNAAQIKLYGTWMGTTESDLTQISANNALCALPFIWLSSSEIVCNLPNTTRLNLTDQVSASAVFYDGDLRAPQTWVGYVVESPPDFVEGTATTIVPTPASISFSLGFFSNWSISDVTFLKLTWSTGFYVDCTSRSWMSSQGELFCNLTSSLDLVPADGNLLKAFAIIGGAPVGPTSITYIALGIPTVTKTSSLSLLSPWNRDFTIPGANFYRANASLNTAILEIDSNIFPCEGTSVSATALKCRIASTVSLPLDVGDVLVREVISNGVSSGSIRVRIAYVSLPPGYGLGPGYAPDGSPLPSGFGSLTSTILVIIVLSGLIVLVLLTFMILSGRTGGDQRAARSLFSTRAVGTVITLVQGPVPQRYQPLVPPGEDTEEAGESSTQSSVSSIAEVDGDEGSDESMRKPKKKREKQAYLEQPNRGSTARPPKPEESEELGSLNSDSEEGSEESDSASDS